MIQDPDQALNETLIELMQKWIETGELKLPGLDDIQALFHGEIVFTAKYLEPECPPGPWKKAWLGLEIGSLIPLSIRGYEKDSDPSVIENLRRRAIHLFYDIGGTAFVYKIAQAVAEGLREGASGSGPGRLFVVITTTGAAVFFSLYGEPFEVALEKAWHWLEEHPPQDQDPDQVCGGPWPYMDHPPKPRPHPHTKDPLILDLNGDGITTTALTNEGLWFDQDNNGFAERTGWIGTGDGLLVMDRNGNGIIDDGTELFGNQAILSNGKTAQNGFEALAELDSNHDGKIDAADSAFSQLRVWEDYTGDGLCFSEELHRGGCKTS